MQMSLKAFLILGDFRLQLPHPVYNLGKWVLSRDLLLLLFFLLSCPLVPGALAPLHLCSLMGGFLPICAVTHRSLTHWPSKEGSVSESVCVCLSVCVCEREREGSRVCCLRLLPLLLPGTPPPPPCPLPDPLHMAHSPSCTSERPSLTQASSTTTDLSPTLFFHSPHP